MGEQYGKMGDGVQDIMLYMYLRRNYNIETNLISSKSSKNIFLDQSKSKTSGISKTE